MNSIKKAIRLTKIKRVFAAVLALVLFASMGAFFQAVAEVKNGIIQEIYISHNNGSTTGEYTISETAKINVRWAIEDNTVKEGDTTYFILPKELTLVQETLTFDMLDGEGNLIAVVVAERATNRVTVTFTDYPERYSSVSGTMEFHSNFNGANIPKTDEYDLQYELPDGSIIEEKIPIRRNDFETSELIYKNRGVFDREDPTLITWSIRVNPAKAFIPNAVVTDTTDPAGLNPSKNYQEHTIIEGSIKVEKVNYYIEGGQIVAQNHEDVTDQMTISVAPPFPAAPTSFRIEFGDVNEESYLVTYNTRTTAQSPHISDMYGNKAVLTGSDSTMVPHPNEAMYAGGSGSGGGEVGRLEICKEDKNTKERLAGAKFNLLRASDARVVATLTTDANGEASVSNLVFGTYTLVEIEAPYGYLLDKTPLGPFTLGSDPETALLSFTIPNRLIPGDVILTKTDRETAEKLAGAIFELQDSVGNKISGGHTTDAEGKLHIQDLPPAEYQLVETQPPPGYILDSTPLGFRIEITQTAAVELEMDNKPCLEFSFIKVGEANPDNPLEGIEFELYTCKMAGTEGHVHDPLAVEGSCWDMDNPFTATSEQNGYVRFDRLTSGGDYMLAETFTAAPYEQPTGQWMITLDDDGNILRIVAKGELKPPAFFQTEDASIYYLSNFVEMELPFTGGAGTGVFTVGGILLLGLATVFLFDRKSQIKNGKNTRVY